MLGPKFGELALLQGLLTDEQLEKSLQMQEILRELGIEKRLGDILATKGWLTRGQVNDILGIQGVESEKDKTEVGGYRLVARIGRGGMSTVFKATQVCMDRVVALKILSPRIIERKGVIERFRHEAMLVGRLNHPSIVQGIELGEEDGYHFFAMEYLEGETLQEILDREVRLDVKAALHYALQIAGALGELWSNRIVHADLKPGNIMITKRGEAKLFDLGLAVDLNNEEVMQTQKGRVFGTPYYISPEQILTQSDLDVRTDIYSLGITLYMMLSGDLPFRACSRAIVMNKHLTEPIRWPPDISRKVPGSVMELVLRMTSKEREERYQSAEELVEAIERILQGGGHGKRQLPVHGNRDLLRVAPKPRKDKSERRDAVENVLFVRADLHRYMLHGEVNDDLPKLLKSLVPGDDLQDYMKRAIFALMDGSLEQSREILKSAKLNGFDVSTALHCIAAVQAPPGMVYVPAGPFLMGSNGVPEESPQREAYTKGYYIDEGLVTNLQYMDFVEAARHAPPVHWERGKISRDIKDLPVVNVSWADAADYAQWADKRLPAEMEWEKAARGTDGRRWPWGDKWVKDRANCSKSDDHRVSSVGKYPSGMSPYGCYDMAGNVMEWTQDDFAPYPGHDGSGQFSPGRKVARGGSYIHQPDFVRCSSRFPLDPLEKVDFCGFRCVRGLKWEI